MTNEVELILEIWESVRDFVPNSKHEAVATDILKSFLNYGIEYSDLATLEDEDTLLGQVLSELVDPEEEVEEEYEEYDE